MIGRPSLLLLTAATAMVSMVTHAVSLAAPASEQEQPTTRLGVAIKKDLATRDQSSVRRNRALDLREQVTRAAETRIKADLLARQKQADASAASKPDGPTAAEGKQYDDLARIYQAMKPAKAALVFEQLDMDVQMKVAQRMRGRSTAMILAAMTPGGAADLSMSLARKTPKIKEPVSSPSVPLPAKRRPAP